MQVVLDASVAVKWFLPEQHSDRADAILSRAQRGEITFVAPDIFHAEFAHAFRKAVIGGRCTRDQADAAMKALLEIPIVIEQSIGLISDALELALRTSGTAYDALYVVVSLRSGSPFVTGDEPVCSTFAGIGRCEYLGRFSL